MAVVTQFPTHILIVEDDVVTSNLLEVAFRESGFIASVARNGGELRKQLACEQVDLITLDLGLPDDDGIELAKEIRAQNDVPIIIISGRTKKIAKIIGLEVGADDYVVKPFDLDELVARVRALLRRSRKPAVAPAVGGHNTPAGQSPGDAIEFERWRFDHVGHRLWTPAGKLVALTAGEIELLAIFVRHPRTPLSRAVIATQLRGEDDTASRRSIDVLVGRLRRKLEKSDNSVELIKTLRGEGYLFCPEVRRIGMPAAQ